MIVNIYNSILFIVSLYMIGRHASGSYNIEKAENSVRKTLNAACLAYILLCVFIVAVSVAPGDVIDTILLYIIEFLKMVILILGAELCAEITNKSISKRNTLYIITSELLFFGVASLAVRTFLDKSQIKNGLFGTQFIIGRNLGLIMYIVFNLVVLFFYGAYTYMFYYSCTKKRETYIFRRCFRIVIVLLAGMLIEAFFYIQLSEYVPVMIFAMLYSLTLFRKLLVYVRTIEYNESDYEGILSPNYEIPALVCNDSGAVIYENPRAFVMRQMYKDTFIGEYLTDIFEISSYDIERLRDEKQTETFDILCRYIKKNREARITVKHNLDRYGEIFSSEVNIYLSESTADNVNIASQADSLLSVNASDEEISIARIETLLMLIEKQIDFFNDDKRELFKLNLPAITKMAQILDMPALKELCIKAEENSHYEYEWEHLDAFVSSLERHKETLKSILSF